MQTRPTSAETEAARRLATAILEMLHAWEEGCRQRHPEPVVQPLAATPALPATAQTEKPKLLSAREAAKALAMSERTLWQLTVPRGPIRVVRVGRAVRYAHEDLDEWIRRTKR